MRFGGPGFAVSSYTRSAGPYRNHE